MKNQPSRVFFAAFLIAAVCLPAGTLFGGKGNSHRVSIETIRDLKLSGYNDDEKGELQWRLEADSAEADPQTKSEDIKRTAWNLSRLKLFTFGDGGEIFAEMTSPEGRFSPEKREADSDAKVEVKGANFTVRGRGWAWSGQGRENQIRVRDSVFVSIALPDKKENLTAMSKRLFIHGEETQTVLTFSGDVKVAYEDIFMACDTLEILVPERSGSRTADLRGAENRDGLKAVRSVTGRGNVKITRGSTQLFGDAAEFLPQEDLFHVRGNARFEDVSGGISVRGDAANGKIDEQFVEILSTKPNPALPGTPIAVSVEMPSLAARGNGDAGTAESGFRTLVSGKRMTIRSAENENVISLFDEVRVTDSDIRIDAEKLVVTADSSGKMPLLETSSDSEKDDLSKVRAVVAEGGVRADYSGRVLHCDRADVFPQENRIFLTGTPKVVSAEENAALSGDRVEIFLDRDVIEVFSEEKSGGNAPAETPRRVTVELPDFASVSESGKNSSRVGDASVGGTTKITGDHLTLTRGDDLSTFDIFGNVLMNSDELSGRCDRLVVFADPKPPSARGASSASRRDAPSDLSQIKKIVAVGNVDLEQDGYVLTGGRASITPAVGLREWVAEDRISSADGDSPFLVVVEPDSETGTRPRITFENAAAGAHLEFALPTGGAPQERGNAVADDASRADADEEDAAELPLSKKKKAAAEKQSAVPARKSYLESNTMELIAGEKRARFFLRGDVIFVTENGANGMCDSVEGLLLPREKTEEEADSSGGFEAKKVVCRGNVRLTHDGSVGRGSTLEIFPPENRAVLSGNATFREKGGLSLRPGNDRFVFDLEKRQMITGEAAGTGDEVPAQVSRPQIIIPKGSDRVFAIPQSMKSKSDK